jgi:hypothetical protein
MAIPRRPMVSGCSWKLLQRGRLFPFIEPPEDEKGESAF